jgi:uncharacterized membrane protein (UPF0136 family)
MIHTLALAVTAGYGILSLTGGVIGFVKAGSRASLIAGGVSGLLLIGSAVLAASQPLVGFIIASVISAALIARFAKSAFGAGAKPVSRVMVFGGLAVLVTAGLALV